MAVRSSGLVCWLLVLALLLTCLPRACNADASVPEPPPPSPAPPTPSANVTACGTEAKCSGRGKCEIGKDGSYTCVCFEGVGSGLYCSEKSPDTAGWGTAVLLAAAVVLSVLFVERIYSGCKKMYLKRTGRDGFSRLPVIDVADHNEMTGINANGESSENPAGGDDEWGLPAHTTDEI